MRGYGGRLDIRPPYQREFIYNDKGKDVAQGVYYVLVKAKGADGRTFNIKRDVNLLRGYTESSTANP